MIEPRNLAAVAAMLAGFPLDPGANKRLVEAYRAVEKGYASRRQEKLVEADLKRREGRG